MLRTWSNRVGKKMDKYPEDFFAPNIKLLKFGGMWVPQKNDSVRLYIFYVIYNSIYIAFCQVYYTPSEIYMLQYTFNDLAKIVEHVGIITTHLLGTYKLYNWFVHRKRYLNVVNVLNSPELRYESFRDIFRPGNETFKEMALSCLCSYGFFAAANGVPAIKALPVLWDLAFVNPGLFSNGTVTCDEFMPYFSWMPFSRATKGLCIGAIVFQAIPITIYAWQIVAHDALFAAMLNGISVHFENLKGAFVTMRKRCLHKLNLENISILYDEEVPFLEQEMYDELRKCTVHLQTMLFLVEEMEFLFTYITLGQVMITLSVFVSRMFLLTSVDLFSSTFAAEMEYLTAVGCQGCFYCIFGSKITFKCSELPQAMFSCDWLSASQRFKKNMLMNMRRLKKPIYITVGKFTPLTLQTLISIIKASYSYFAVLNSQK